MYQAMYVAQDIKGAGIKRAECCISVYMLTDWLHFFWGLHYMMTGIAFCWSKQKEHDVKCANFLFFLFLVSAKCLIWLNLCAEVYSIIYFKFHGLSVKK
jgi:hypothetical protein